MNTWDLMKQGIERWRQRNTSPWERLSCPVDPKVELVEVVVPAPAVHAGIQKVLTLMQDGHWMTLQGMRCCTGLTENTALRYLQRLKDPKYGGHTVEKRRVPHSTLWEYRLIVNSQMTCL